MKKVKTTCPYCGVGCGVLAASDGTISGDPDHPSNFGRLCSKGAALGETLGWEGRLLSPQIGGSRASWDDSLDLVASKFRAAIRDHGPDSVAFYVSGQLLSEDYYVANKLMKGYIGSANIDTNSRLCMASSVAGHKRAFGKDTVPGTYEDLDQADVIVLTGSNLAWCHPVLFQRILAAKVERPSLKIITIDPRRTATSAASDLHLAIRPDGDTALFNGLLAEIVARGAVDQNYVDSYVNGFVATHSAALKSKPEETGLSQDDIDTFCDLWIGSQKVVTIYSQGVNQSIGGSDKVNAIINCHLATGRIGRAGMGPFSVTGQPNAMGGREVGGLANMLACHLDIENSEHRESVQAAWQSPTICTKAGFKAVDMFKACEGGQIKALWVMATNPAVSMPDADAVVRAIKNVDFSVVSEVMSNTDTGLLCDVQLPATAWAEKTGTVTNSERRISLQKGFLPAPGESRADWKIICDVAQRMGWKDGFSFSKPVDIFREHAMLSGRAAGLGGDFDISKLANITDAQYDNFTPVQWPVGEQKTVNGRFFSKGGFFHADGKAKMLPVASPERHARKNGSFHLNTGRIRDQWHTMTRSGKSARLNQHCPEPFVEIHPDDAIELGIVANELLRIDASRGQSVMRATITDGVQRGTVFAPMHWGNAHAPRGRINATVASVIDPVSGQPALKGSQVQVKRFDAAWYGFAVSTEKITPDMPYSAIARTKSGWRCELAGTEPVKNWEDLARRVLNVAGGSASIMSDPRLGTARVAIHRGSALKGLFFASSSPLTIARDLAISQIANSNSAMIALAGTDAADRLSSGPIICACHNVGLYTINKSIEGGADTLRSLGNCTAAGTNCGSCKSELQTLIDTTAISTLERQEEEA